MGSECEDQMLNMMSCSLNSCLCFSATGSCTIPTTLGLRTVSVLSLDPDLTRLLVSRLHAHM